VPWEEIAKLGGVVLIACYVIYRLFNLLDKMSTEIGETLATLRDAILALKQLIEDFVKYQWRGKE